MPMCVSMFNIVKATATSEGHVNESSVSWCAQGAELFDCYGIVGGQQIFLSFVLLFDL